MKVDCPHAARCAGCPLIDLTIDEQLARKRARLARAIGRYPGLSIEIDDTVPADPITGYRVRAKLVAGKGLGLFAKDEDHAVVDIPECRVLSPALLRAADAVRRARIPGLRAVDLREAERVLITLVLDEGTAPDEASIRAIDPDASIAISFQAPEHPQILGRDLRVLSGGAVRDPIDEGVWTYAAHGAFVQAHRPQAAAIYRAIRDALAPLSGKRVIDAFAGSGAIGLVLAKAGARVLAIESFPPAAERAQEAAAAQGLSLEVAIGDATQIVAGLDHADAIVLDPPRRGLDPELRFACAALGPEKIAMLSCEPATLARDLDHFARLGYRTARARPFDLMPLTDEVETLAILEPAEPVAPRVLYRDDRLVALDKSPFEPTTPQDGRVRSLLERARAALGLDRAVPLHRLDGGTSGVCLFATGPEHADELSRAMHDKRYVALARGIARMKGTIRRPLLIDGRKKDARTTYRRRAVVHGHSLLEVTIDTGRTHQIRRHLAMIGHPVLGDRRYGHEASNRHFANKYFLDRPFLHCARITVGDRVIESPLPGDLAAVLAP